jgi:hypothetical protein
MSSKNLNIYDQIVDMELHDLENQMILLQNQLIGDYDVLDEMWKYHPANPDFINPIKVYDEFKKSINVIENKLEDLELKINHLKSTN